MVHWGIEAPVRKLGSKPDFEPIHILYKRYVVTHALSSKVAFCLQYITVTKVVTKAILKGGQTEELNFQYYLLVRWVADSCLPIPIGEAAKCIATPCQLFHHEIQTSHNESPRYHYDYLPIQNIHWEG